MSSTSEPGRRERSKQDKLVRITNAASELLAERPIDDVTTREIAERADVPTGTLFLYAQNKGELLLLAHNAAYEQALETGVAAAQDAVDALEAVLAILGPVVACNRSQIENGRTYLREMVFGDPREPHHAAAIALSQRTERAVADAIERLGGVAADEAAERARIVSAIMLLAMGSPRAVQLTQDEVIATLREQTSLVIGER